MEKNLRHTLGIADGDWTVLWNSDLAIGLWVVAFVGLVLPYIVGSICAAHAGGGLGRQSGRLILRTSNFDDQYGLGKIGCRGRFASCLYAYREREKIAHERKDNGITDQGATDNPSVVPETA